MFDLLQERKHIEPRPWHRWLAAVMAVLVLADLGLFALHHHARSAPLVFACVDAGVVVVAWLLSLAGRIQPFLAFAIATTCLAALFLVAIS